MNLKEMRYIIHNFPDEKIPRRKKREALKYFVNNLDKFQIKKFELINIIIYLFDNLKWELKDWEVM